MNRASAPTKVPSLMVFRSIADALDSLPDDHVICAEPGNRGQTIWQAQAAGDVRLPYDRFHRPCRALVAATTARLRLQEMVTLCSADRDLERNPEGLVALRELGWLIGRPLQRPLTVGELLPVIRALAQLAPAPAQVSNRVTREMASLATLLENDLMNPGAELDLGEISPDTLDGFTEAGGLSRYLALRPTVEPPLRVLTLPAELEELPRFLEQLPSLRTLYIPSYDGDSIDLRGLSFLSEVRLTGEFDEGLAGRVTMPEFLKPSGQHPAVIEE